MSETEKDLPSPTELIAQTREQSIQSIIDRQQQPPPPSKRYVKSGRQRHTRPLDLAENRREEPDSIWTDS